ncbi:hypothetical protein ACET3Z_018406 [Daucus carota]
MGEMPKLATDNRFLVDVVGEIWNVRANIKSTKTDSEKILTKFDLCDGRHTVAVTLFDDFGTEFEQTLRCCKDQQVFVIICAAKIGLYEGLPNLTNYSATRIYINPGHYSVRQLRERIAAMPRAKAASPPVEEMIFPMLTVKQIQSLPESSECKVNCKVRVTKVEENASWYYAICTKCPAEIVKENGVFNCMNCKRIIPYPDKSDSTRTIAIIFLDEDVSRILEKTVFDVKVELFEAKTEGQSPQQLKELQNEVYDITLNITADNLKKGSKLEDDNMNTPNTEISSTKTRPRVHIEPLPFDPKGASPAKAIKKENPEKHGKQVYIISKHSDRIPCHQSEDQSSCNTALEGYNKEKRGIYVFQHPATGLQDIVGVITDHEIYINNITNRHGEVQEQAKFAITDGSSLWKVIFWDKFARLFVKAIWEKMETPVIIIIAGCRVQNFNIQQIQSLDKEFIQRNVLAHVNIMQVDGNQPWFLYVCTSCNSEVEPKDDLYFCQICTRIVPYPEIRFRLVVLASDITGTIQIILHDRQIRTLIGKRARQLIQEQGPSNHFPHCFSLLAQKPYTIKLEINEININSKCTLYWATNICHGFKLKGTEDKVEQTVTTNDTEATTSTVGLQGLSGLNCNSSAITKD